MLDIVSPQEAQKILQMKNYDSEPVINEVIQKINLVQIKNLPSQFKGYPEGTKISYEPITLGELESLNSADIDITRSFAMLLNAIHCNTIPVEDLYYWDIVYIGIQRKLLAFGDTRGVLYAQCPVCKEIVEKEFDYTELEFKEIEAPALPIIATIANQQLEFSLITIKDFLEIDIEKGELDVYARMVKNKPYDEAYQIISNCYGKDIKLMKFIDEKLNYGLLPFKVSCTGKVNVENPNYDPLDKNSKKIVEQNCTEEMLMEVRSPFEVVFPKSQSYRPDEFEIQYGRE